MANIRILAVACVALLMVSSIELGECSFIKYGDLNANRIPKQNTPPNPANEYHRGCNAAERCRPGERTSGTQPESSHVDI
ncbi:hypothetical protein F511_27284 [Dorcoceras hygrometricum]|uniref:Uncharacterized protein n=1 Tax=Dorcoceras hygrometricum TaxID=472368 RepID=A0A2Z7AWK5_9LAMI|nr:hypothetical protein F511_27284 [Dorcoceras hygrometricum]